MKVSVIVPTYNRPAALRLSLLSLSRQSRLPDEVLIADDGSGDETRETIRQFEKSSCCNFPIKHIWQEDDGFRKPRIINESVRNATGDYLIFIDGDCIAHCHFVKSHLHLAAPNVILGGKRVEIGPKLTETLLNKQDCNCLGLKIFCSSLFKESRKAEEAIRITSQLVRRLLGRTKITDDGIWGCNFSLPKDLFYSINGCDEDFLDGSVEDNDIGIRVLNGGGRMISVRSLAIVYHLWHKSSWNTDNAKYRHNIMIIERRKAQREYRCANGIVKPPVLDPRSA